MPPTALYQTPRDGGLWLLDSENYMKSDASVLNTVHCLLVRHSFRTSSTALIR